MKFFLSVFLLISFAANAQFNQETIRQYINTYKDTAMAEMVRTGVPAAITLAQGIHESGAGTGMLVQKSNNHFGIKCKNTWTGRTVSHDDDARGECFRAYDDPYQSYKDHSDFLKANQRYAFLFQYDPADYRAWAYGLKRAGYATNPKYPDLLIKLIEENGLNDYSLLAIGRMQPVNADVAVVNEVPATQTAFVIENADTRQHSGIIASTPQNPQLTRHASETVIDYPAGTFKINNCKVMFAEAGTSLLAIAAKNGVQLPDLFDWNDMTDRADVLQTGQLIFLEKKQKKGEQATYEVKPGETMWSISQVTGVRISSIMQYNAVGSLYKPAPGTQLKLK